MKIKHSLPFTTIGLSLIIIFMFLITWQSSNDLEYDGLIINLAGRQRMLSQKLTKEIFHYHAAIDRTGQPTPEHQEAIRNTMKVFETTLDALINSGKAPLSLDLKTTEYRECPPAKEPALGQLKTVRNLWKEFSGKISLCLEDCKDNDQLAWFAENNLPLLKEMDKAVVMMQKQSEQKISRLLTLQVFSIIVGIILMLFSMKVVLNLLNNLGKIKTFAGKLGSGDLTAHSSVTSRDELGEITSDFNEMASNLHQMFTKLGSDVSSLNNASTNLHQLSIRMSSEAEDVADLSAAVSSSTDTMSTNMDSVAAATEEASTNVTLVAEAAKEMTGVINAIFKNTEEAKHISNEAVAEAKGASEKVNELGTAADEIGKVTETITEISEQTNLLALNATIEAARAGEAGKGFAVVANEIKELAKQTAQATNEIKGRIAGIQGSAQGTVDQILQISRVIDKVSEIVSSITEAVKGQAATTAEIATNVEQASLGVQEVTENVASTSVLSKEVAEKMVNVNNSSSQISTSSSQVKTDARALAELAAGLREAIGRFRI